MELLYLGFLRGSYREHVVVHIRVGLVLQTRTQAPRRTGVLASGDVAVVEVQLQPLSDALPEAT
jgi:hypothetical protein